MAAAGVAYDNLPKATPLFLDYVHQFERVQGYFAGPPNELASYHQVAAGVSNRAEERKELVDILTAQNRAFGGSEETLGNVRRLLDPSVLVVATGQQVGLFSGPALTLYKALTAVKLARHLTSQGIECVPVFWLATEDHDLEEVAHVDLLNEAGDLVALSDEGIRPAPHSPVGYVKLSPEIAHTLDRLEKMMPAGEARDRLMQDLRACYVPGATWAESFGRFLTSLLGRFGVVMIDPLEARVHRLVGSAYRRALAGAARFRELLARRSQELVSAGYHAQVHVGDDSTLLFVTTTGERSAVREREGQFQVNGFSARSESAMEEWIEKSPVAFSPSALFRPVIQDVLLGSVACVAGPSELAYLAQAQALYPEFSRPMPVVFPRAGFTLADRRIERLLHKYQLTLEDVWRGEEYVRRRIAASGTAEAGGSSTEANPGPTAAPQNHSGAREAWAARLTEGEQYLKRMLEGLREDVKAIDPTLTDALATTEEKMLYQLDRLHGKISRAAVQRFDLLKRHGDELLKTLTPSGNLQEREVSGVYFLARAGYGLLDRLLDEISTERFGHEWLVY